MFFYTLHILAWVQLNNKEKVSYCRIQASQSEYNNNKMKCPHFQKVCFERVKQVMNDESTVQEQLAQLLNNSIFSMQSLSNDLYNIPEQGIDHVNSFKNKVNNYRYSFNNIGPKQDTIRQGSKIRMPKQMSIKKMNTYSGNNLFSSPTLQAFEEQECRLKSFQVKVPISDEDGQIPSQYQHCHSRRNPHVLISKTSMMTHDSFQIFNGVVFLCQKQQNPYQCQLRNNVIKVSKQEKIKYFIELQKVSVSLQKLSQNQRGVRISLKCKNKADSIKLYFMSAFQKQIFSGVYLSCVRKIKQTIKLKKAIEEQKQNFRHVTNFQSCNIQSDQQSQILNQKGLTNQNNEDQASQSLSINSYQGDSLVFETQRMLFSQVKDVGNTFDVLLFKNKSLMSKVQRIFTNSDFDHTAMLLRTASNDLLMLQATSNSGVAIYTFNSLMKIDKDKYFSRYFSSNFRVGLRRYTGEKNSTKISRLQNFIRKTVGKKYKFDPMYLIKSQANQQKQTFFCSQLVAQALQDVGILSDQYPSFKYLPKHFGEQNLNSQIINGRYSDIIILE